MAKVFIGVGHGGKDSGAVANGLIEKNLNLVTALACKDVLVNHGVTVLMSRLTDEYETASDRAKEANGFKPDVSLDIHYNAGGGNGAECFYDWHGGTSKTLAENVLTEVVAIGQNSRGAKTKKNILGQNYYAFIRQTNEPAIIVECAFLDNKEDITIIDSESEQKAMGVAIAKGVLKTLGIAYKEPVKVEDKPETEKLYKVQVGAYKIKSNAEKTLEELKKHGFKGFIKYE